jgi:hypothetical protein
VVSQLFAAASAASLTQHDESRAPLLFRNAFWAFPVAPALLALDTWTPYVARLTERAKDAVSCRPRPSAAPSSLSAVGTRSLVACTLCHPFAAGSFSFSYWGPKKAAVVKAGWTVKAVG